MTNQGVYPVEDTLTAGDQISSTYEGRMITLYADDLTHGTGVDYVTKGLPVSWGNAVGIAMNTQAAGENPLIAVDTEGIWVIDVKASDDGGDVAVIPGDKLYFNTTTGVVSKIASTPLYGAEVSLPLGYALGHVPSSSLNTIAVKVHWDRTYSLLDAETLYFGDDNDIAVYWTGAQLNIITGSGGGGDLVELQGYLTVAGTFTCNAAGVFGLSLTCGSLHCNGGGAFGGQVAANSLFTGGTCEVGGRLSVSSTIHINNPPVADPSEGGVLWDNAGVINRSHG